MCLNFLELSSPSLVCLELSGIVRIFFSCVLARLKISVLVDLVFRLESKFPCLFPFLSYFIVDPVPFLFLFFCFIPIRQNLNLVARDLSSDVCFLWI